MQKQIIILKLVNIAGVQDIKMYVYCNQAPTKQICAIQYFVKV